MLYSHNLECSKRRIHEKKRFCRECFFGMVYERGAYKPGVKLPAPGLKGLSLDKIQL